jgi:hypothetical protein
VQSQDSAFELHGFEAPTKLPELIEKIGSKEVNKKANYIHSE